MVFDSGKNVKPLCSADFYIEMKAFFFNVLLCLWAVCSRDGSSQPNHHYPNGSELPGPLWGIALKLSLCSLAGRCSKCLFSSILETRCPWGIQDALHDATDWNQQGQQDTALQHSERGKRDWFCFYVDFNWVSNLESNIRHLVISCVWLKTGEKKRLFDFNKPRLVNLSWMLEMFSC